MRCEEDVSDNHPWRRHARIFRATGHQGKYWLPIGDELYLFKVGRPGTGENWAEKIAAELAELLGLPHSQYDLAVWRGQKGMLSPRIVPEGGKLILGNESLADIHADYPKDEIRRAGAHTLGRIHALLIDPAVRLPPNRQPLGKAIATAYDLFLGVSAAGRLDCQPGSSS